MPGSPFLYGTNWNAITVSGVTWHGKVDIKGAKRSYKWDVKNGAGLEGATETYRGKKPEAFTVDFYIWTDTQYTLWQTFSIAFQYSGTKSLVIPVDIYHPALDNLGISQVICEDLGAVEPVGDALMYKASVKLREFLPPPPVNATSTPLAAAPSPPNSPTVPNPAIVALQAKIAALQAQAQAAGVAGDLP